MSRGIGVWFIDEAAAVPGGGGDVAACLDVALALDAGCCVMPLDYDQLLKLELEVPGNSSTSCDGRYPLASVCAVSASREWSVATVDEICRDLELGAFLGLGAVMLPALPAKDDPILPVVASLMAKHAAAHALPRVWIACAPDRHSWHAWRAICDLWRLAAIRTNGLPSEDEASNFYVRGGAVSLVMVPPACAALEPPPPREDLHRFFGDHIAAFVVPPQPIQGMEWWSADLMRTTALPVMMASLESDPDIVQKEFEAHEALVLATPQSWARAACVGQSESLVAAEAQVLRCANVMQVPLQPLGDHLPSAVYEVFERDRVKYEAYGNAIRQAVRKLASTAAVSDRIVVFVVGAGRGPLVTEALHALESRASQGRHGVVIAVEKNPSAFRLLELKSKQHPLWVDATARSKLRLIRGDMRHVGRPDDLSDTTDAVVVVSELLGSFGDNELSPECVDGFLVSARLSSHPRLEVVPKRYTSFVTPVSSAVFTDALLDKGQIIRVARGLKRSLASAFHQLHVVHPANFAPVAALTVDPAAIGPSFAQCFDFVHTPLAQGHECVAEATFIVDAAVARLTGFLGVFDAVLFDGLDGARLSTLPSLHTAGMFSWSPVYLPLLFDGGSAAGVVATEIEVLRGDVVHVCLRRRHMPTASTPPTHATAMALEWQCVVRRDSTVIAQSFVMNAEGAEYRVWL